MTQENAYLTIEDVARRFGVNPTTVYRLAQRGELPAFKVGSQWRFNLKMLEAWVADQITIERFKVDRRVKRNHHHQLINPKATR